MISFTESAVEEALIEFFKELGYSYLPAKEFDPEGVAPERTDFREVVLNGRLSSALSRLNPGLPAYAREEAAAKLVRAESPSLVQNNKVFHKQLVDGVPVEFQKDGRIVHENAKVVDFEHPENNDFLVANQFTVVEGRCARRADVVVFVNGLPLAVFELKNAADEKATIGSAFNQLQTYKEEVPNLLHFNELLVISDGVGARVGTISSNYERFAPWKTVHGDEQAPGTSLQLEVLTKGIFEKSRFLELIRHFIVFEEGDKETVKKVAGYHQFHAVQEAIKSTVEAAMPRGDRRCGVVWHTQGSGKSLTMVFYAGKVILHPFMENPTIVVLTDRNDLDDQLFGTFARCSQLLRQEPAQAESREHLKNLLSVACGGVVFTTIQKFFPQEKAEAHPLLSARRNIVVIADEAHRSQYDFVDGFARHMRDALPNASFIGFTGTPIELTDKNTRAVFGNYISIYDIYQAVQDGATVPIYYESRLAKLELNQSERPTLDKDFDEITEGEEQENKEKLKSKWAALEAVVGAEKRVGLVAADIVSHFEKRAEVLDGKAMIVCMSRRICVELYNAIIKLRPAWHSDDDAKGAIKIVMTGSASDKPEWQKHIRNKQKREELAKRFKDPADEMKLVIVRDMWLTGFDVPCLHTMYADKPMKGHGLMQAIARVNRVFKDKPGGLVVDYLGLAEQLKNALSVYTESGGKGQGAFDQENAVKVMLEKYEVCCGIFHNFNWSLWKAGSSSQKLGLLPMAQEHILSLEKGKERYKNAVTALSQAFALSVPNEKALAIRDDVAFFQAVKSALVKTTEGDDWQRQEDYSHAIKQMISKAIAPEGVVDIFKAAGLKNPDISILSDQFLQEVKEMPQKNLAVELLNRLLKDEIRATAKRNLVLSRSFAEMLENTIRGYNNRAIEAAKVIEELIQIAKDINAAKNRGEKLKLSEDELAFYDALETNDSAVKVLGDEKLRTIARELVETVRNNISIDWTIRESAQAKIRVMVKKILRKYGYPPDKQEKATLTILEQAKLICQEIAQ